VAGPDDVERPTESTKESALSSTVSSTVGSIEELVQRPRLLLVEDDRELSGLLASLLDEERYAVTVARDGQQGLHLGLSRAWDLMILDRGLPALEGVDLLARLRARGVRAPILMLTARGTVADRVEGLDTGANDYLVKPFDVEELLARLRALLRPSADLAEELPLGDRVLLVAADRVVGHGVPDVQLSGREGALLQTLARRPNRVFTRDELLGAIFEGADTPGAVDTYVHYLRRKLGREVVRTVHGLGYRMGRA
jgi:two-component system, OmpR family, response regulator QseB